MLRQRFDDLRFILTLAAVATAGSLLTTLFG
jgi:hypothetical protein